MYSALVEENIHGWKENQLIFQLFNNLFRKNDKN